MSEEYQHHGSSQHRGSGSGRRTSSYNSNHRGGHRFDRSGGDRHFDRHDGDRRHSGRRFDREDGGRRNGERRDQERRYEQHDGERSLGRRDGYRNGDRDNQRFDRRNGEHRGGRRYDRRDGEHRFNRRDGERHGSRSTQGSKSFYQGARQNSDGTISYPSQNPYTDRRPDEPVMPKGLEWSMLSKDEKERLRGLSKEHAENIGLHMLAAYALADDDPQWALQHARWIARQASRIDMAREVLAFLAYRQGDYKLALREFKTAYRMNGFLDYLPFMADCERGLGHPERAIELALSDDAKGLRGESKAEMFLVLAGAQGDLGNWDKAVEIVHTLGHSRGISGEYRMRAIQAEQNFLEQAGRSDEAAALDTLVEQLEDQYADIDSDDDAIIDNDLEDVSDDILQGLGIDTDPSHYVDSSTEQDDTEQDNPDQAGVVDADVTDADSTTDDEAVDDGSDADDIVTDDTTESEQSNDTGITEETAISTSDSADDEQ